METSYMIQRGLYIASNKKVEVLSDSHVFDEVIALGKSDNKPLPEKSTGGVEYCFSVDSHEYAEFQKSVDFVRGLIRSEKQVMIHSGPSIDQALAVATAAIAVEYSTEPQMAFKQSHRSGEREIDGPLWQSVLNYVSKTEMPGRKIF